MKKIILAGEGWGAKSAYKGLKRKFQDIYLLTKDDKLIEEAKSAKIIKSFDDVEYDYVLCAGYKLFIAKKYTDTQKFINIHYSLLPQYRGLHSTVWAILNNEKKLGLTIHLMNEYMDDGDIIYQFSVDNDFKSSSVDYMQLFNKHIELKLGDILSDYINGRIIANKQNKRKASWVGKRNLEDCRVNCNKSIDYQKAFFRSLVKPYPIPFFEYDNSLYFPLKVKFQKSNIETHIGRILNIDNEGVWIKLLDGYMIFNLIQDSRGRNVDNYFFKIGKYIK